jgi:3',5'-cyclic AMP phosphodiesterase CpdA
MRFALIGDIHVGPEAHWKGILRKMNKDVIRYVQESLEEIIKAGPSFVVQMGDLIEDSGHKEDKINYARGVDMLKELDCPVHHILGNHDQYNLSQAEIKEMAGVDNWYYSIDDKYHFVFLCSAFGNKVAGKINQEQIEWLKKDLAATDKKTVVFVHHALDNQDLTGNPWFEGNEGDCLIENRQEVRKVLEESGKVLAVIQGHLHWNRMNVHNSIPYFTVQSLVENASDMGVPAKAYSIVDLTEESIKIEVRGNDPATLRYSF